MTIEMLVKLIENSIKRVEDIEKKNESYAWKYGACESELNYIYRLVKQYKEDNEHGNI